MGRATVGTCESFELRGVYDCHVHCGPDVIARAQDVTEFAAAAREAGLAGAVLKDHTGSTAAVAALLNRLDPAGPRFYGSLTLNPPVGSLNPYAVEAALRLGARVIYFPTYAARYQIEVLGPAAFAEAFPRPREASAGVSVLDGQGRVCREALDIVDCIAGYDAVLATGHLSPREALALVESAAARGVTRMLITHASEPVPGMSIDDQKRAAARGALVEHSIMALTDCCPRKVSLDEFAEQLRQVGAENVVLSSDLGQAQNGPPLALFGACLGQLMSCGFSQAELLTMTRDNPQRLLSRVPRRTGGPASQRLP
jgi:hypothetical protein